MRRTRSGYTLVESLVVTVLVSTTLTIATAFMHSLHRAEQRIRSGLEQARTMHRLALSLREDAHQASSALLTDTAETEGSSLILQLESERAIEYKIRPNAVDRVVHTGQNIDHHERFRLPGLSTEWSVDTTRLRPLVRLQVSESSTEVRGRAAKRQTIDATVGVPGVFTQ